MNRADTFRRRVADGDFLAILEAKAAGDTQALHEASLARVFKHVEDARKEPYGMLSSNRAGRSKAENDAAAKKLQSDVRSLGLGFVKLRGHWKECQDTGVPYEACDPDHIIDVTEPSLFVPGLPLADAVRLGKKYDQDAVVFAGPETEGKATLIFRDHKRQNLGAFTPNGVSRAYSELKNKSFFFEWVAQTHVEVLLEENWKSPGVTEVSPTPVIAAAHSLKAAARSLKP